MFKLLHMFILLNICMSVCMNRNVYLTKISPLCNSPFLLSVISPLLHLLFFNFPQLFYSENALSHYPLPLLTNIYPSSEC